MWLSPEEWVRQHMLHFLVNHQGYPAKMIGVEVPLKLHGMSKRADIVVYTRSLTPWLLVECKAPEIKLTQYVFDQAARYNLKMQVPYLIITNGMRVLAAEIHFSEEKATPIAEIPRYAG